MMTRSANISQMLDVKSSLLLIVDVQEKLMPVISEQEISSLIIAGVETHICISQTALEAIGQYNVHVVSDAVSSRTRENHKVGIERMYQNSIVITSTEMVMFELLKKADTEELKKH